MATILIADDEPDLGAALQMLLEGVGHQVFLASDGDEAVAVFHEHQDDIELAMLDILMPRMTGDQVFRVLRQAKPDLPVIFMTGYAPPEKISAIATYERVCLLTKPFHATELFQAIANLMS